MEYNPGAGVFALLFLLSLYFLPFIIALIRRRQAVAIFLLNLFLGWTFLGWIIALIWSVTEKQQQTTIVNNAVSAPGPQS